ncbi:MAG: hypothetical protein ACU85V_04755, partial [Gammaproteobacteria bacterium]
VTNSGDTSVAAGGSLTSAGGATYATRDVTTAGTVTIAGDSSLTCTGGYTQTGAAAVSTIHGTLGTGPAGVSLEGGVLRGNGTINGDVVSSATIRAGASPGTLNIVGDLTLNAGSVIDFELGGTGAGQYDVINVGGAVIFGGSANALEFGGYIPIDGDVFTVMNIGTPSAPGFDVMHSSFPSDPGAFVTAQYNADSLVLTMSAAATAPPPPPPAPAPPPTTPAADPVPAPPPAAEPAAPELLPLVEDLLAAATTDPILVLQNSTPILVSSLASGELVDPIDDSETEAAARISCN